MKPDVLGAQGADDIENERLLIKDKGPIASRLSSSPLAWTWTVLGPGLLVCLADTDAGCLVVAAQSGARWGYALLALQLVLIPVLYLAQELTVRLAICTQMGHTACIREQFGPVWAWITTSLLVISCVGAVISEMSGVASVAELWGFSRLVGTFGAAILVASVVILCNYRQVEYIGVTLGMFEIVFIFTMFLLKPDPVDMVKGFAEFPVEKPEFSELVASNIGAVIMPWMIYFQQSAIVARKMHTAEDMQNERSTTLFGSFLTQFVMIGTMVSMAAAHPNNTDLNDVGDIAQALAPTFGLTLSQVLVSLGFVGGSISGAFVVALAAAWAVCEAGQWDNRFSLDSSFKDSPVFYSSFIAVIVVGVLVLLSGVDVIRLNVYIELMDALLMPMAIGFLYALATGPQCPEGIRVTGLHKGLLAIVFTLCTIFALGSGFYSIFSGK
jgi:NRAMP (natural resistance-associated macrophage protein)-like metal ion transporter